MTDLHDPLAWIDDDIISEVLQEPVTLAKTSTTYGPIRAASWVTPDKTTVEVKVARGLAAKVLRLATGTGQEVSPGVWLVGEGKARWYHPTGWGQVRVIGSSDPVLASSLAARIAVARKG